MSHFKQHFCPKTGKPAPPPAPIAIIGAGLAGLTLALSLQRASIPCTIYELRSSSSAANAGGAIMISPNGLRILDTLDLYKPLTQLGWIFESLHYIQREKGEGAQWKENGKYFFGDEKRYGYKALRVYRREVLRLLREAVAERGIKVEYEKRFVGVIDENEDGVRIKFEDGDEVDAPLLVGADGIHSSVRKLVVPEITGPTYSGICAITGAVNRGALDFSEGDVPMPVTIQGPAGAFVFAPQRPDGEELLAGTQFKYPEQDREGWARLSADKAQVREMLGHDKEASKLVRSAVENIKEETMNVWSFYVVPKLRTWSSEKGKVVILGDAAHAVPPTTGQGATQAFEDGFSLAALIKHGFSGDKQKESLAWWQGARQARIDQVMVLTARLNNARLPDEERNKLPKDELWSSDGAEDLAWLYNYGVEEEVEKWARRS